jgi:uncharacterized protein YjbJ (UPF0337 family)
MDWNEIEGNWKNFRGKIKEQWGKLTDDDLQEISGKKDQLLGKLQAKYGSDKNIVEKELETFLNSLKKETN